MKKEDGTYKDVQEIAGIGPKSAEDLKAIGFDKAYHILVRNFFMLFFK